jgi:hypothetical protein
MAACRPIRQASFFAERSRLGRNAVACVRKDLEEGRLSVLPIEDVPPDGLILTMSMVWQTSHRPAPPADGLSIASSKCRWKRAKCRNRRSLGRRREGLGKNLLSMPHDERMSIERFWRKAATRQTHHRHEQVDEVQG